MNQFKEWTKEEIIKSIKVFYDNNKRTPKTSEFLLKNGLPSYTHVRKILDCTLIEDIFSLCDLTRTETPIGNKINKQWGLDKLKEYTKKYNKILTREEFKKYNLEPAYGWFGKIFGSYKQACFEAGLVDKLLTSEERIQISVNELISLAYRLNKCPTVAEFESINHKGYVRKDFEKHLNMKYNDICRKYIPEFKLNNDLDIPKEKIIEDIKNVYNQLGRSPLFNELKDFGLSYSFTIFNSKFNMNYNELLIYIGLQPMGSTTLVRNQEQMLKEFNDLFFKLKRLPLVKEFDDPLNNTANHSTYIRHFGSIENVCKLLHIDFDKYYKTKTPGKSCLDKNGGKCRSFIECIITNYYIDNQLEYIKEPKYNEVIKGDTRRFDWGLVIGNKKLYVEYAGMYYPNKMYSSINRKYIEKIDNKIKDLKDIGVYDQCLFIFPDDLKSKTLKEIFEPFIGIELEEQDNKYKINSVEYFTKTNEELLEIIMKYSDNQDVLPSTTIISKNEQGVYNEIRKRFKTYDKFARYFGKSTIKPIRKYYISSDINNINQKVNY